MALNRERIGLHSSRGRPLGSFTQHRRIDRLREHLLRHPRGLTLYEMAHTLGATTRTIRRYLGELRRQYDLESVDAKHGPALRWKIRASELPRKVELRRTQAYALLATRRIFESTRGSALFDEIDMAVDKLMAFARRPGRGPNAGLADARLEERFVYLPCGPKDYSGKADELDEVFQAVSDLKPLLCRYRNSSKDPEEKVTIHPYALVLHKDSIYCIGLQPERAEVRTLLLDHMRDTVAVDTERFEVPRGFNVQDYFQGELGVWRSEARHKVVIEFDAAAAQVLKLRQVHSSQKLTALSGGGARLSLSVGNLTQLTRWVLEWGEHARALEPPELVTRVRVQLAAALAQYGNDPARAARPARTRRAQR